MEEYYNPSLKEFINAVLDGKDIYGNTYLPTSDNPEYILIDFNDPGNTNVYAYNKLDGISRTMHRNNETLASFIRFNNLLKFLEIQNEWIGLKKNVAEEIKIKDRDLTEGDYEHLYFPELTTIFLKK
jgi:hypothetical protein